MSEVPIIFIHRSGIKDTINKQSFLRTTFKCASLFNPSKKIYFLGDEGNENFSKGIADNIKFYNVLDYGYETEEFKTFEDIFRVVKGKKHGYDEWIKFTFQRFFHLYDFLEKQDIDSFWIFDSDTMIITDLKFQENKYAQYDCTEQCNGMCMNGFISNKDIVKKYIRHINKLFMDKEYLKKQQYEFDTKHLDYAFTEMRAYENFRYNTNIKTIDLSTIIDNTTFDNCICQCNGPNNDTKNTWEMDNKVQRKKLYFRKNGIFIKWLPTNSLIKLNSLNLSWVPNELFEDIFAIAKTIKNKKTSK